MLTIKKDNNEKIVTKGAYENFYKPLGYIIITGDKSNKKLENKEVENKETTIKENKDKETEKKTKEFKDYSRK